MGRPPSPEGQAWRDAIVRALAVRYLNFDVPPTFDSLSAELGTSPTNLRHHVARLRAPMRVPGLIHPDGLQITAAGLAYYRQLSTDVPEPPR